MRRAAAWPWVLAACAAAPASGDARAWFAATGERPFAMVPVIAADATRSWLVVGGRPAEDGVAMLFATDATQVRQQRLGDDVAYAVAVAGSIAAVAMADGEVLRLSLPDLQPTLRWRHAKAAVAVAFSPDGAWLASGGADGLVRVGLAGDNTAATELDHGAPVTCVAWAADGQRLAAGTRDGKVRLHDRKGRLLRTWNRLGGEVVEVSWFEDRVRCRVRATPVAEPEERPLPWP